VSERVMSGMRRVWDNGWGEVIKWRGEELMVGIIEGDQREGMVVGRCMDVIFPRATPNNLLVSHTSNTWDIL